MRPEEVITLPAPALNLPSPPRSKWEQEYQAFRRLLPSLLATHRGKFVVIHEGQVVESGDNDVELALQFFRRYGNVSPHIGRVTAEPEPPVPSPLSDYPGTWGTVMIRYRYANSLAPPAPFVSVTMVNPATGAEV
jgi:hypothetical protein